MILLLLFLFFGLSTQKLYNIRQLTKEGSHSHPKFSADNRYVYFTASGSTYDKNCSEIYRLDLKYSNKLNHPNRISRVSTGLGYSSWASLNYEGEASLVYESTFEQAIDEQKVDRSTGTCPYNKCADSPKPSLCNSPHIMRFSDTYTYRSSASSPLLQRLHDPLASFSYSYAPTQFGQTLAYGQLCETQAQPWSADAYETNSTCFMINGDKPFNEDPGFAIYYDAFSIGKEKMSGKVRVTYQESRFSTLDLPDINIFPLDNVDIYDGMLEADGKTIRTGYSNRYCEPDYSTKMLFPQVYEPEDEPGTLYTAVDKKGRVSVNACFGRGFRKEQITDSSYDAMMASPRPDHKQIVFVQRTSAYEDFQLYIADVEENLVSNFDPKSMTSVNKEAISNMQLLGYVELDGQLGRARLSQHNKDIYFEQNLNIDNAKCNQVYYVDNSLNDFSSPSLLSTGLGSVDGFDIIGQSSTKKIVYAGDFLKPAKDATKENVHRCYPVGCDDPEADTALKNFCNGKVTKHFGRNFELFITGPYGHIETRVTNNDNYEGEVATDHKNNRIYYSKVSAGRVDIAYRDINNLDTEIVVTKDLKPGYYGGVAVGSEGRIIYHAYKPTTTELNEFRIMLDTYQVVDVSRLEIYAYNLDNKNEIAVTNLGARSMNPTYTDDRTVLFQSNANHPNTFSMYSAKITETGSTEIDVDPTNIRSISFGSQSVSDFIFVADSSNSNKNLLYLGTYKAFRDTTSTSTSTTQRPHRTNTFAHGEEQISTTTPNSATQVVAQTVLLLVAAFFLVL